MFYSNRTLGGFWDAALENPSCVRCQERIQEHQIWDIDEKGEKGAWAAIAQVFSKNSLSGGILCGDCILLFRKWMKEGEEK